MQKSGFDLRQRLGAGDATVDQIFSKSRFIRMSQGDMRTEANLNNDLKGIDKKRSVLSHYNSKVFKLQQETLQMQKQPTMVSS